MDGQLTKYIVLLNALPDDYFPVNNVIKKSEKNLLNPGFYILGEASNF